MTFREYLLSFRSTWGALSGLALVLAGVLKFTALVPPWPDEAGVSASALAVVSCVVGVTIGYFLPFSTENRRKLFGIVLVLLAMCLLLFYLYSVSLRIVPFSQPVGDSEVVRRVVVGTEVMNADDAKKSAKELIELYGIDASAWTLQSVTNSRICLLTSYMSFYLALTCGLGSLQGMRR